MRHYLIPENGHFYKANMHTHSNISDGVRSVEQIKEAYKAEGYSVVAFTDHDVMIDHSDLNDEHFLALTSYEVETNAPNTNGEPWSKIPTYHLNFYAKDPHKTEYACPNPRYATIGNAGKHVQNFYTGDYERRYSVEGQNDMIAKANAAGYLVCYNHASWSRQHYPDYAGLEGLCALEVYNTGCYREGYCLDASDYVLDDMLAQGKRVYPIAADDSHGLYDCFGGWVRFKAPALTYGDIMTALEKGNFYASWGPDIEALYLEDGILHIRCTPIREAFVNTDRRVAMRCVASDGLMTHVEFDLRGYFADSLAHGLEDSAFIRMILVDAKGDRALTRGYFMDELSPDACGKM